MANVFQEIVDALVHLDDEKTVRLVRDKIGMGENPQNLLESLTAALNVVGEKYGKGEYYLSELVMAAEIFRITMELIRPYLQVEQQHLSGSIVIGTVEGDLHDIGKNIFIALARNAGFKVVDLGVDVPPLRLIEAVTSEKADILGMSGILTLSVNPMKQAVEILKEKGMRDSIKVIIGGLPLDEMWREQVGADAATDDAYEGLQIVKRFMGVK